jgi:hypothetical protein
VTRRLALALLLSTSLYGCKAAQPSCEDVGRLEDYRVQALQLGYIEFAQKAEAERRLAERNC